MATLNKTNGLRRKTIEPYTYWGIHYGWMYEYEAIERINKDFDKYLEENDLKFRTMASMEGLKICFQFKTQRHKI